MDYHPHLLDRLRGVSTSHFSLIYDGDALRDGEMDVRDLAPAILAAGKLFEDANLEFNPQHATISVKVQAGFDKGSFDIFLNIHQDFITQIKGLFTSANVVTAAALVTIIFGSRGLIDLLKLAFGEKPKSKTELADGNVRLTFGDGNNIRDITVNQNVFKLYENGPVRHSVKSVVQPLERSGIDALKAMQEHVVLSEMSKKDLVGLTKIDMDERQISETETEGFLQIVSLSFKEDNKWRLFDGSSEAFYGIEDSGFIKDIEQRKETFGKNDILKCRYKLTTSLTKEGELKTERTITKVLEHTSVPRQTKLFPRPADH